MEDLFQRNLASGRLSFTTDMKAGVSGADVVMIAVGTPPHPVTKEADLKYIRAAAEELAQYLDGYTVVATKSTVPVGTGMMWNLLSAGLIRKLIAMWFHCPSFCAKDFAVHDFLIRIGLLSALIRKSQKCFVGIVSSVCRED